MEVLNAFFPVLDTFGISSLFPNSLMVYMFGVCHVIDDHHPDVHINNLRTHTSRFLQRIFEMYKQPFAITYLGVSLMVVYLPIALVRDWFCSLFHSGLSMNLYSGNSVIASTIGLNIPPLRVNDMNDDPESDLRGCLITDKDIGEEGEGWPLNVKDKEDEPNLLQQNSELCSWEICKCSLYLAPIWFITEVT